MRLVDADAVEKQAYDDVHYHAELEDWEFDVVTHYLDHAPTIDAVEVIRCKDCKFQGTIKCPTYHKNYFSEKESWELDGEDDFCSYGERKGGGSP